ncbi:dihydroneopterin aldolase [Orrella daihaiensis]|uniref:Dihydroneopterin aldolase n=1 Tax=Orrella daihaiensis TaxID=2782176 RepID=A0ABY4AK37_9BURK|nr:dihydroneopterin aldolase [Orrella daihaiensis]UOD50021.1 dihydroneopterin aldolase [Orrella daihaiensis]
MTLHSTIELSDVPVKAHIGVFASGDSDPYEHLLDLTLRVDPALVLIKQDGMAHVFDYDPLLEQIHAVSQNKRYETQEILASHIVRCCAKFKQIQGVEICLKKSRPDGTGGTVCGRIGVRLFVNGEDLAALRS